MEPRATTCACMLGGEKRRCVSLRKLALLDCSFVYLFFLLFVCPTKENLCSQCNVIGRINPVSFPKRKVLPQPFFFFCCCFFQIELNPKQTRMADVTAQQHGSDSFHVCACVCVFVGEGPLGTCAPCTGCVCVYACPSPSTVFDVVLSHVINNTPPPPSV